MPSDLIIIINNTAVWKEKGMKEIWSTNSNKNSGGNNMDIIKNCLDAIANNNAVWSNNGNNNIINTTITSKEGVGKKVIQSDDYIGINIANPSKEGVGIPDAVLPKYNNSDHINTTSWIIIVNNNNSVIIATKQVTGGNNKQYYFVPYKGWTKKNSYVCYPVQW